MTSSTWFSVSFRDSGRGDTIVHGIARGRVLSLAVHIDASDVEADVPHVLAEGILKHSDGL